MSSRVRKATPSASEGSRPPRTKTNNKKKLVKLKSEDDSIDTNTHTRPLSSSRSTNPSINHNTSSSSSKRKAPTVDNGGHAAVAVKHALGRGGGVCSGGGDRENEEDEGAVSESIAYKDPTPLKWVIFEAAAKANGQR